MAEWQRSRLIPTSGIGSEKEAKSGRAERPCRVDALPPVPFRRDGS